MDAPGDGDREHGTERDASARDFDTGGGGHGSGDEGLVVPVRTDVRDMEGMYRGPLGRVVFRSDAVS